jgi:hypothetical protein
MEIAYKVIVYFAVSARFDGEAVKTFSVVYIIFI